MARVELIYDNDCPNVSAARSQLSRACAELELAPDWIERNRDDPTVPDYVQRYGSPTILVDGKDVAGAKPSDNISCCRLYAGSDAGFNRVPSVEMIVTALRNLHGENRSKNVARGIAEWRSSLVVLPGIGASVLPVGACPACWPAYAGILGSVGFGFMFERAYFLPLTTLFLVMAVATLFYKAKMRNGYGPFVLGLASSATVLTGKFVIESDLAMYGGIAMLVTASLWNAWLGKKAGTSKNACSACTSTGQSSLSN